MSFPAMETLKANLSHLSARDQSFAQSLIEWSRTRPLSAKQGACIVGLAKKAEQAAVEAAKPPQAVRTADVSAKTELFSGVRSMFDRNVDEGVKRMAVRLLTAEGVKLRVSLASDRVRLHVAEQASDDVEGRYFGFIDSNGEFRKSGRTPHDESAMVALRELDANPKEVALSYGRLTGTCCMCGAELTNKVSIAEGIGPICGGRIGF